jgi:hypothetical protein
MSSLFKHKGLGLSRPTSYSDPEPVVTEQYSGQVDDLDDYQPDDNVDYEPDHYDNEPAATDNPQQSVPQPTHPMPMKKVFTSSPTPAASTATPVQFTAPAPATAPAQPATPAATIPAATNHEVASRLDNNMVSMSTKIDRVLHGRLRYLSFKTGKTQTALVEEFIRLHCPEVP